VGGGGLFEPGQEIIPPVWAVQYLPHHFVPGKECGMPCARLALKPLKTNQMDWIFVVDLRTSSK